MKQLDLKPVGLTDRMEHNATAANFAQIEDAVNSNAITAEEMYAELNGKLAAEANMRKAGDDSEARDRQAADEELEQRITKLEKIIFGQNPLEIKDTVPTKAESTAVEINDSLATQIFLE
ncbi:hypothetical protein [Limosilactobacillus ingluviei]|uniref:hypothetical protein n=1 Tax=Limosilactobacillus ingluviei TaxID=148604 RepID=UPI00265E784F|nr:hypothetical protein [Limosilactobacillus ingluviei]